MAYQRVDQYDEATTAQLDEHYRAILNLLGEDADIVVTSAFTGAFKTDSTLRQEFRLKIK